MLKQSLEVEVIMILDRWELRRKQRDVNGLRLDGRINSCSDFKNTTAQILQL